MQTIDHLGSLDDVLAVLSEPARSIILAVREQIVRISPNACEVPSPRESLIWWGTGPRKMTDGRVYVVGHRAHANLGFFKGSELLDPSGILGGPGKRMRHVRLSSATDLAAPDVLALLEQAFDCGCSPAADP